jgi:hypothetical protein
MGDSGIKDKIKRSEDMPEAEFLAEVDRREKNTLEYTEKNPPVSTQQFDYAHVRVTITEHFTKEGCWRYTKAVIESGGRDPIVIPRNYSDMWHLYVEHPNGMKYILCGHDYQGYDCVNLTKWVRHRYLPREALFGAGFCWSSVEWEEDPDKPQLIVNGCYWGGPFEIVVYDFSKPDELPYPELSRRWEDERDEEDEEEWSSDASEV